ncbi:hypothetical protein C8J57DRAFT_1235270 [Mycena rebaudengoi]|nr:hypothetical protein C8J57DRAFT_1235270 [Mycena rebaudengoi]
MLLDGLRDELAELEISIAHHQSCLKRLEGRKAAVHEQLANFTYPVLTLPPEIFLRCIAPHHYYPIFSKAPLILLQIFKAWHALALFIPALWTDLDIDIKHQELELEAAERLEQFNRTWFARGGSIPRSFRFTGELDRLNAIIYDHAAHFGDLHLFTTMSCFLSLRGGAPFPMLREMEIEDIYGVEVRLAMLVDFGHHRDHTQNPKAVTPRKSNLFLSFTHSQLTVLFLRLFDCI